MHAATNGHLPIEVLIIMRPVFVRHNYRQLPISALLDALVGLEAILCIHAVYGREEFVCLHTHLVCLCYQFMFIIVKNIRGIVFLLAPSYTGPVQYC